MIQILRGVSSLECVMLILYGSSMFFNQAIAEEELNRQQGDATMTSTVTEITRRHFEEAFANARRSVNVADLVKYDNFRRKFDPMYKSGDGTGCVHIDWPETSSAGAMYQKVKQ